jgi:hypothetical protein
MAKNVSIFDGTAWVSIVGPPGADGKDGKDGSGVDIKGTASVYPPSATPDVGDMWIVADPVPAGFPAGTNPGEGLVWDGTSWVNVGSIRGPAGKDGADGADGAPGQDGQAGADGAPGADGVGFTFRGEWDGSAYAVNDVVTYQGTTYIMIAGFGDEDITDTTAWAPLATKGADGAAGADGAPGADGQGFTYKGEFVAGPDYDNYDVVTYLGSSYVQIANPSSTGVTPDAEPASWQLIASKGADGAAAAAGEKGDKGDAGADGAPGADGADGRSVAVTKSPTQPATAAIGDFWIEE